MMLPLVSVIIPLFNCENYIEETLLSVVNQTYKKLEIIVVNDGSDDNSLQKANSIIDSRIIILNQENKGASATRNLGLRYATGKYIQFLDADDLISSEKIEKQVIVLENSDEYSIAYCSTIYFFNGENHLEKFQNEYDKAFLNFSSDPVKFMINLWGGYTGKSSMIQPNAWLTPKKLIDKIGYWDEEVTLDDDGEFFARAVLNSNKLIFTEGAYNYYRKFRKSSSLSMQKTEKSFVSLLNSTLSKKGVLLSKDNSFEAKVAIYRLIVDVMLQTYISYPIIYNRASIELPKIQYPYKIIVGGNPLTQLISKKINWRFALCASHIFKIIKVKLEIITN